MNWKEALRDKGFIEITGGRWRKTRSGRAYSDDNDLEEFGVIRISLKRGYFGFNNTLAIAIGKNGRRYALRHSNQKEVERFFGGYHFREWRRGVFLYPGEVILPNGERF